MLRIGAKCLPIELGIQPIRPRLALGRGRSRPKEKGSKGFEAGGQRFSEGYRRPANQREIKVTSFRTWAPGTKRHTHKTKPHHQPPTFVANMRCWGDNKGRPGKQSGANYKRQYTDQVPKAKLRGAIKADGKRQSGGTEQKKGK